MCPICGTDHSSICIRYRYRPKGRAYTPGGGRDLEKEPCTVPNIKWIYSALCGLDWMEAWSDFRTLVYWTASDLKVNWRR